MKGIKYILAASVFVAVCGAVAIALERESSLSDAALAVTSTVLGAIVAGLLLNEDK